MAGDHHSEGQIQSKTCRGRRRGRGVAEAASGDGDVIHNGFAIPRRSGRGQLQLGLDLELWQARCRSEGGIPSHWT